MIRQLTSNKFLNKDELSHLKKIIDVKEPDRNQLLIKFALMTGARASEILRLTNKSFDTTTRSVHVRGNKGSLDREFVLPKRFFNQLLSLTSNSNNSDNSNDDRLFPITYTRLHQIWQYYAPNKKKFHALRHTFAVEGYIKTKDLRAIQVALGHKDVKNTGVYLDFYYTKEYISKILTKFPEDSRR